MTLQQALRDGRRVLSARNVEDAALECEILLRHVLNIDRVQLFLELDRELDTEQADLFRRLVERRATGEPSAYITGHREFYGLDFYVTPDVLIPRPETELLVEKTIELVGRYGISTIADIGTGSGAIAVALALNLPQVRIYATDVSERALEIARTNCQRYGVLDRVMLLHGDMLSPLPGPVELMVANLPYVPKSELAPGGPLRFEPVPALDGGGDGVDRIRQLIGELRNKPGLTDYLLLEIGQGQAGGVTGLLGEAFPAASIETIKDWGEIERVVVLTQERVADKLITVCSAPKTAEFERRNSHSEDDCLRQTGD